MRRTPVDSSFDVVYHSHFIEHLEREAAFWFLEECYRVLKPNGTLRVVAPDLELFTKRYLSTLSQLCLCELNQNGEVFMTEHLQNIDTMLSQIVKLGKRGLSEQTTVVRWIERLLRGKGTKTSELERHLWMYDRFTLGNLLKGIGFKDIKVEEAQTSRIEGWSRFNLDTAKDGTVRKCDSQYIEARRPID